MFYKNFKPFFSPKDVEEETGGLDQGSDANPDESGTDETPNVEDTMTEPLEPRSRSEKMFAKMAGNPSFQNFEARSRREHFLDDLAKSKGSSGGGSPMVSVTYQELVALRDGSRLVPGMQYRITDYVCTVANDAEAQAVSHPYDIIVTADDAGTLNENARACLHEGDTYYSAEGSVADLTAWELKYCLDNDTSRFAWADTANGKGVVFWLKDEHGNECPYDFKQIQFKRYKITACEKAPNLVGTWSVPDIENITIDAEDYIWAFTFSYITGKETEDQGIDDWSVIQHGKYVTQDNVIATRFIPGGEIDFNTTFEKSVLNNIVWTGYDLTGKGGVEPGIAPIANTFGNDCGYNTFGNDCGSNTFGNDCGSNTFGNNCWSNTFGNNCRSNTFGNSAQNAQTSAYCRCCTFDDGVQYVNILNDSATDANPIQNYHVLNGTKGTNNSKITVNASLGLSYCTYVGKNSSGVVKTWAPADLVQS